MYAIPPPEPPLRLRDLIDAMRKLGSSVRRVQPPAAHVSDARGAALAVTTCDGAIVSVNRSAAALLGYASADLVGKQLAGFAHDEDRAAVEMHLCGGTDEAFRSFDVTLTDRTGRRTSFHVYQQTLASDASGGPLRLTLFVEPVVVPAEEISRSAANAEWHDDAQHRRATWLSMGQQHERERLAAELHDGMGQALTLIKLMVEDARMRLRRGQVDDAAQLLDATVLQIRDTIGEMRQICGELRPLALQRLGLPAALSTLCRRVEQSSERLRVVFACGIEDGDIPDHLKADIFRVVQEALNNIISHAAASEVHVDLQGDATTLLLSIRDDGSGYDMHPLSGSDAHSNGLGLTGMQNRVEAHGGAFSVSARSEGGTEVAASWRI
ncbi:sensor histidine kinase [Paraburkholderia sp. HP33-1]|uniref:sensor histidine kinase n=1 Tax=Paraburkholderia sp. HP33-1 TaxID=2883243 RepID=UPI001F3F3400|nr:histidine kinase [Paraburkholderia sp. HP33-1]